MSPGEHLEYTRASVPQWGRIGALLGVHRKSLLSPHPEKLRATSQGQLSALLAESLTLALPVL